MHDIQKSALFFRQARLFARAYAQDVNAGTVVALRFVDMVEDATKFIQQSPFYCPVYTQMLSIIRSYKMWNTENGV